MAHINIRTKLELQNGILLLVSCRISFVIAHRLSTISNYDHIYYIEPAASLSRARTRSSGPSTSRTGIFSCSSPAFYWGSEAPRTGPCSSLRWLLFCFVFCVCDTPMDPSISNMFWLMGCVMSGKGFTVLSCCSRSGRHGRLASETSMVV